VMIGHHGAIRGQNRFSNVRVFINLSRMTPSVRDVEDLTETLTGRVASRVAADANGSATYNHSEGSRHRRHIMRAGGVVAAEHAEWHPDPNVERVRRQLTDAEADQADGRSRAIRRDATTPLLHIRATALPSERLQIDELVKMDDVVPFDAFDALTARGVFVPTGNSHKGGCRLLAAIVSAEETLLRGQPAKTTPNAVRLALRRKPLTRSNVIENTIYDVRTSERLSEGSSDLNNRSVETELRSQPGTWSEWQLPGSRFAVTLFLRLPVGTDAATAGAFLVGRTFLPAADVAGLAAKVRRSR
jgi:hypothetical protein